jgi:heterodisulfide reductase subunit B
VKYAFYPGCSLEGSSVAYARSIEAVAEALGIEFEEVDDWNCCGATEYAALEGLTACAVVARNLARVDSRHAQLVAPCSACYLNLKRVDRRMAEDPALGARVNAALAAGGLHYEPGRVRVRHLLDVLHTDVGGEALRERVVAPLAGLRVAPYYGCQIVRPLNGFDDAEYPTKLDQLLGWIGAEVVDYPLKSHCCGGHLTQISEAMAFELIRRLLQGAAERQTHVIACLCPMCQLNLDAYQGRVNALFHTHFNLPVLFFTQLLGLALDLDAGKLGLGKELVAATPVLAAAASEQARRAQESRPGAERRDGTGVPDPSGGRPWPKESASTSATAGPTSPAR